MRSAALLAMVAVVALAATPPTFADHSGPGSSCNQIVTGHVVLQHDLLCIESDGLIVGASGTTIDMNGFRIDCVSPIGYFGSCQGPAPSDPDPEIAIDTNGHSNVLVYDHTQVDALRGIFGFDVGIHVRGGAHVTVRNLRIFGPFDFPANARPLTQGILVTDTSCDSRNEAVVLIGGGDAGKAAGQDGNVGQGFTSGLELRRAACVNIGHNSFPRNSSDLFESHGILLLDSGHNTLHNNSAIENSGLVGTGGGGLTMVGAGSTANTVTENRVSSNRADGITLRAGANGNQIANNIALQNGRSDPAVFRDLSGRASGPLNVWNQNNVCATQNEEVPPGVCGPEEFQ